MRYGIDLGLDKYCYYSKTVTIKTEQEKNYDRLTDETDIKKRNGHSLITTLKYVITVYNETTKQVIEIVETTNEDSLGRLFNGLKTKHILDYENIHTTNTPEESKEAGTYDFGRVRRSLSGRRG